MRHWLRKILFEKKGSPMVRERSRPWFRRTDVGAPYLSRPEKVLTVVAFVLLMIVLIGWAVFAIVALLHFSS